MNLKSKWIFLSLVLVLLMAALSGCADDSSHYQRIDAEGHTISICYDANGGYFTSTTSVIVDSYDPAEIPQQNGVGSIALLSPDDPVRGIDAFPPINNGYFLAGWYAERTQTADGYVYSQKWDFSADKLEVDLSKSYTSAQPVLTLYAVWVPLFEIEFYEMGTGEYLNSITFDPTEGMQFQVPSWNEDTGAIDMYKFPKRNGYTFNAVSYDQEGTQPITEDVLIHPGQVDAATGTAQNSTLKLYVDYREGEWYHIYNVEQFLDNASVSASFEIYADLDFADEIWPTSLMYGNYTGTINGNGHTFSNITLSQTNNSKTNAGLFGNLTDTAVLRDLTLENVTFTIESGTRAAGTSYGLLAGTVSTGAQITDVVILRSTLQIDSGCYFGTEEYVIGLICGSGSTDIDPSGITTAAVGNAPEKVLIQVEGQVVTIEISLE